MAEELLRVEHLKQYFKLGDNVLRAVDDVSFSIGKGEVFGLVGESGCGKTTTGRAIIRLYEPTAGDVYFKGYHVASGQKSGSLLKRDARQSAQMKIAQLEAEMKRALDREPLNASRITEDYTARIEQAKAKLNQELADITANRAAREKADLAACDRDYREKRAAQINAKYDALPVNEQEHRQTELRLAQRDTVMSKMQMIFQDPIASINPRMTVREIIAEGLTIRGIKDKKYIDERVFEMLEMVGLVREHADRYPHEFSGGQRQRIGIARAIVMEPELIIADEPISALDVSIQAQVINLLNDLRDRMGLTIMFIAHNLSVVKYFSDRIAVMYFGKIVEMAGADELFAHPLHPYTKSLLSAIPYPDPHYEKRRKRVTYQPQLAHDYSREEPTLREIAPGHFIHCNTEEFENYKKLL